MLTPPTSPAGQVEEGAHDYLRVAVLADHRRRARAGRWAVLRLRLPPGPVRYGPVAVQGESAATGNLRGRLSTGYPDDWSSKKTDVRLAPHLSTVDALIVGTELAELLLTHAFGLDPGQRRRSWVRRLDIRAAASPQEDLRDLPLEVALIRSAAVKDDPGSTESTVRSRIGSMTVTAQVRHPSATLPWRTIRVDHPDALLGPAAQRYHGRWFESRGQRLTDVGLDRAAHTARTRVELVTEAGTSAAPTDGIGIDRFPAPTAVDAFVVNLQLAQALLYQLDDMDRGNSNTLWMRSTHLVLDAAHTPTAGDYEATAALENIRRVHMGGQTWRVADSVGDIAGVHLRCALAHHLPAA